MKYKLTILLIISLFIINNSNAQTKKQSKKVILKGIVLDNGNMPVQNASIFIEGKKATTVSDAEGRFQVRIKRRVKSITVFSLFKGAVEVDYNGEEELTFVLSTENSLREDPLDKVDTEESDLINIGFGNAHKRNLSTSVGEPDKDQFKNAHRYNTIFEMIKGEMSGVEVTGNDVVIRGKSSLNFSSKPLFVVDGNPTFNISNIPPDNVKSISILKGGAAAIYGSRGANGVILITLKTGRKD